MTDTHHITQGRFNPVHQGHAMVVQHVMSAAKKDKAGHTILVTGSHDAKKNPLTPEQKVKHLKRAVPGAHVQAMGKEHPTLLHQASKLHKQGVKHLVMHVGSDRVKEFHDLLHRYNGATGRHGHYNFKSIKVKSVGGERKEGGHGVESASGTAMRKHAAAGDRESFHKMAPSSMSHKHKDELYHDVRKGMGVHESNYMGFKEYIFEVNSAAGPVVRGTGDVSGEPKGNLTNYQLGNIADSDNKNNIMFQQKKAHAQMHTAVKAK